MPIAKLGITIGTPFARRLVDLIGPIRTKDLLLTGRILNVQEAMPKDFREGVTAFLEKRVPDFKNK